MDLKETRFTTATAFSEKSKVYKGSAGPMSDASNKSGQKRLDGEKDAPKS